MSRALLKSAVSSLVVAFGVAACSAEPATLVTVKAEPGKEVKLTEVTHQGEVDCRTDERPVLFKVEEFPMRGVLKSGSACSGQNYSGSLSYVATAAGRDDVLIEQAAKHWYCLTATCRGADRIHYVIDVE